MNLNKNMEKPQYNGWVQIITSDQELNDFEYKELKSGSFYKTGLIPNCSKAYLRVFLEDNSFHIIHERHFRVLDDNECKQLDRNNTIIELIENGR